MSNDSRRTTPLPPGWKTTRARILRRDHHTCQRCGHPGTHVDHIISAAAGGTDTDDNLQTLCSRCHASKTGREAGARSRQNYAPRQRPPEQHPGEITPPSG